MLPHLSSLLLFSVLFLSVLIFVEAHTNMISVNGNRACVRSFRNDSPFTDANSNMMKCNGNNSPAGSTCSVAAGSSVTLKWFHGGTGCIDPSHHGPITVWLSADNGNTFSKIWHDGFHGGGSSGKPGTWATDVLIRNGCSISVRIPTGLKGGRYILRSELVAHHESNRQGGAQYYVGCADIQVTGGASCALSPRLPIPGHIRGPSDPSIFVDIYGGPGKLSGYKPPGGSLATCGGSNTGGGNTGGGNTGGNTRTAKPKCTNNNPPPPARGQPQYSCTQQRGWNNCKQSWMKGYCCNVC